MFIAFPVAGYVMNKWLQDFAYKTAIEWWMFAIAGLLTIGIALLTVSYQSIKAALNNPVQVIANRIKICTMIKNYLKIAFRNLWKYKSFSAINIGGLAIGMAACLLILQYVSFKLSYDQFNRNAKGYLPGRQ